MTVAERAVQIWQLLIGAARVRQTLTYSMVADAIGMGAGTLAQPLELVMGFCDRNGLPPLTVLVVNQATGRPGAGLSTLEELNRDRERVFNYPWFRLAPLRPEGLVIPAAPEEGR